MAGENLAPKNADTFVSSSDKPIVADLIPQVEIDHKEFRIQPPKIIVEVIADRKKPNRRERFDKKPSGLNGVDLIIEPGSDPQFSKGRVRRLQADADRIATYRRYQSEFEEAKERLIEAANEQEGFRGIASERGMYEAPLIPVDQKVIYDPDLLEESTGDFHSLLVREEGRIILDLPFGTDESARQQLVEFTEVVAHLMVDLYGRDPAEVNRFITQVVVQRLDEQRMNSLIAEGKIQLLPGTRDAVLTWSTPINTTTEAAKPNRQRKLAKKP